MKSILTYIMMMMLTAIAGIAPAAVAASPSAASITRNAVDKIKSSGSITVDFTAVSGSHSTKGSITMSGNRFIIQSPESSTWYDGHNMWVLSEATKEVNLSIPTAQELTEINPFNMISTLLTSYNPRLLKSPSGTECIEYNLKAEHKLNISRAVITFNQSTLLPAKMLLTVDGRPITVTVDKITTGKKLPDSRFRFEQSKHPGTELIDLR